MKNILTNKTQNERTRCITEYYLIAFFIGTAASSLGWGEGHWEGENEKHRRAYIYPPLPLSYILISVVSFPIIQYMVGDDTPIYIHEKKFWLVGVNRGQEA